MPDQVYKNEQHAKEVLEFLIAQYHQAIDPHQRPFVLAVQILEGELIGHVGVSPRGESVEIGYAIGQAHTDRGYATQAVEAFSEWVASNLNIRKLIGIVACENINSIKVLEKTGYILSTEAHMHYLGEIKKCREYYFQNSTI